jgi:hypothetical protein
LGRAQQNERIQRIGLLLGTAEYDPESQTRIVALRHGPEAPVVAALKRATRTIPVVFASAHVG